ncbi:MAG: 50S ribosomal protein L11 methyltransferase [Hyphomicrobium sp.]
MRIEYHRTLIADGVRNRAFRDALQAVIVPGVTTVADIGAGTGLLGLIASKLGAKEVYLYETAEVAGVAAEILKRNRATNCHLFPCHSTEMDDPPLADVVVSETLGNYALEENILETVKDARARHLKPGGVLIPRRITQQVAPVIVPRIHDELLAWDRVGRGLGATIGIDFEPARMMSLNNIYVRTLAPDECLGADTGPGRSMSGAVVWDTIELASDNRPARKGEARWATNAPAAVYGFAVWWEAELTPGIALSTAPDAPRTHWEQLYLPLLQPILLATGETLALSLRSKSTSETGTHIAWTATHLDAKGKSCGRQALDLDKGFLP